MDNIRRAIATFSIVAILSSFVVSTANAGAFNDVSSGAYYYDAIEALVADGIIDATGVETYNPGGALTRALAAKYAVEGAGWEVVEHDTVTFTDVPKTHAQFDLIGTAADHDILNGYGNKPGYFGPEDTINRAEFAQVIVAAFELAVDEEATCVFTDVPATAWFHDAVCTAADYGIIFGKTATTFAPAESINRADGAVMVYRAQDAEEPVDPTDPEVTGGGDLEVSLSDESPVGDTMPDGATAVPVAMWDFTAGDNGATIESLAVHTYGVTSLAASHNVYLYDGADRLTSGKSVNGTTNEATFTSLNLDIEAGETKTLTLKLTTGTAAAYASATEVAFELASAEAVDAGDSDVSGDFPVQADKFGISATNGGSLTIEKNGVITNPKVGEDDVVIAKFKMNPATESAKIEQLGLLVTGTVSNDAVKNLELYVSGTDEPLATVEALNSSDIAAFVLDTPYEIAKGETKSFTVKADFDTGRSGDTVFVYIDETTDVVAIGGTYGYGVTVVTNTATTGYDGVTTACTATAGTCSYSTMEGGDITITSNGPVTSTYGLGADDVHLLDFSIVSISDITVKNLPIYVYTNSSAAGATGLLNAASAANYADFKIINTETGETVMGPVDATSMYTTAYATVVTESGAATDNDGYYLFADEFDMGAGEELNLALTMDISTTASTGETIYGALQLGTTYPQMKDMNNKTITNSSSLVPASTLTGKTMTLATPSLTLSLVSVPASKTYVKGMKNVDFTGISAQCGSASDCKVTDAVVTGYVDDSGTADNWESDSAAADHATSMTAYVGTIWLEDSAGVVVGAPKSVSCSTSSCTATFDDMAWEIEAGDTEIFYIVGNISSDSFATTDAENIAFGIATAGDVDFEDDDGNTRNSTGTVNNTATGATDPSTFVTTAAGGVLTVAVDSGTPNENILVAGTSDQTISKFKFSGTREAYKVQKLSINARQANAGTIADIDDADIGAYDNNVSSVKISYTNSAGTTETKNGYLTNGTASFGGLDLYIPEDDDTILTVSANLNTISGGAQAGEFIDLNVAFNDFEAIGQSSGETYNVADIDATTVATGSYIDFGTITYVDGAAAFLVADADFAVTGPTLNTTISLTMDNNGGGDPGLILPVGTIVCIDEDNGGTCATENVLVVQSYTDGTTDTYTMYVADNAGAEFADNSQILFALPGTGYLTNAKQMHVYEAKPSITLSSTSPAAASRLVSGTDDAFVFELRETGGQDKIAIRAGTALTTGASGFESDSGTDITVSNSVTTAGLQVDGTGTSATLTSLVANDSTSFDAGATGIIDDYSRINFWISWTETAAGDDAGFADLSIATHTAAATNASAQVTALSQSACGANQATLVSTEWYNCDVALPTGTDSADRYIHLVYEDATELSNTDVIYIDQIKLYNDKLKVSISTDTDLDTYANNTSNAAGPVEAYLKESGTTLATGYWETLTNGGTATTTGSVTFIPTTAIEVSKGSMRTLKVQTDTSDLLHEDEGTADPVTFSISLGTALNGTVTAGNFWWNDTDFANVTAGGVPGTSYDWDETPGMIKWLGDVSNATFNGNTINY